MDFNGLLFCTIASNAAVSSSTVLECNKWSGNGPENKISSGLVVWGEGIIINRPRLMADDISRLRLTADEEARQGKANMAPES